MNEQKRLTYCETQSPIDVQFWNALREKKLLEWKLEEPIVNIHGYLSINPSSCIPNTSCNAVYFRASSFNHPSEETHAPSQGAFDCLITGYLQNFNTLDILRSSNIKETVFKTMTQALLKTLVFTQHKTKEAEELAWLSAPFALFSMFTFVDAKSYVFHHCGSFPAFTLDSPLYTDFLSLGQKDTPFSVDTEGAIRKYGLDLLRQNPSSVCAPFLAVLGDDNALPTCMPFSSTQLALLLEGGQNVIVCIHDFSDVPTSLCWPMRNFLVCLRLSFPSIHNITIYAIRSCGPEHSLYLKCHCDPLDSVSVSLINDIKISTEKVCQKETLPFLNLTGWRQKKIGRVDLSGMLDPILRADADSRFNLELMRWRVLPSLELSRLSSCKALLLGTGTLGCNVARSLLMWGVRNITLVDRGSVSYSNLARQSLFSVTDASEGKKKVDAAASALKAIIPSANISSVAMTIHMPGHRVDEEKVEETKKEIEKLADLIRAHDVVFLLTDSREARWLPSVLAAAFGTPVLNTALGYDTYVVMRHGIVANASTSNLVPQEALQQAGPCNIGCYFCSDVVAPTDSISGRTLDQQCTVTRPAVSSIASAIAVELLAQLYQHQDGFCCAPFREGYQDGISRLGVIPQQIRGNVHSHKMYHLHAERNAQCTACSAGILENYQLHGTDFLLQCIQSPSQIEEASGLKALREKWEAEMEEISSGSDEE